MTGGGEVDDDSSVQVPHVLGPVIGALWRVRIRSETPLWLSLSLHDRVAVEPFVYVIDTGLIHETDGAVVSDRNVSVTWALFPAPSTAEIVSVVSAAAMDHEYERVAVPDKKVALDVGDQPVPLLRLWKVCEVTPVSASVHVAVTVNECDSLPLNQTSFPTFETVDRPFPSVPVTVSDDRTGGVVSMMTGSL
jgi:hypothetical protein